MNSSLPKWERFAQERPFWYVDMAYDDDPDRFWQHGCEQAQDILEATAPYTSSRDTVLEIGCGVGRLLLPMARQFDHAVGVDLAPTMLSYLRQHATEQDVDVQAYLPDEPWRSHRADVVYSKIVFRHIEEWDVIEDYIRGVGQVLKDDGVALLGFDTKPATLAYQIREQVPDLFLPAKWRSGARGVRRSPHRLEQAFARHGLRILEQRAPRSGAHDYLLATTPPPNGR